MSGFGLSDGAAAALRALLAKLGERAGRPVTLEGLIASWAGVVKEIETGYGLSLYDYLNDLDVRGVLQDIVDRGPSELKQPLRTALAPLDARFRMATRRPKVRLRVGASDWWLRIPKAPPDELRADLEEGGFV